MQRWESLDNYKWWQTLFMGSLYSVDDEVSEIINRLIDAHAPITDVSRCTLKLGNIELWIENWPYAYGYIYEGGLSGKDLPNRITRLRLKDYVRDAIVLGRVERIEKAVRDAIKPKTKPKTKKRKKA